LQHERDIFQHQPGGLVAAFSDQVEDGRDEAGFGTPDTLCSTDLAQILAGEARRDDVARWQTPEFPYVRYEFYVSEVGPKDTASQRIILTEHRAAVTCAREALFESSDAGEQPDRDQPRSLIGGMRQLTSPPLL
jgi:hypothetical protein